MAPSGSNVNHGVRDGRLTIPLEHLAVLNWLGDVGAEGATERLGALVSGDVTVDAEQAMSGYVSEQTADVQFGTEDRVGARVRLPEKRAGHVLVLFSPASANRMTTLMLRDTVDDLSTVSVDMARDALLELCSMLANGFLDEWADFIGAEIDVSAPQFVSNTERNIMSYLARTQDDMGLYIAVRLRLPDHDVDVTLYMFPEQREFVNSVRQVDPGVILQ